MTNYHINKQGNPAVCKAASDETCPRGGRHFASKDAAVFYIELQSPEDRWRQQLKLPKPTTKRKFREYTRSGTPVTVYAGIFDRTAYNLYRSGQCFALAAALTEANSGTPVLAYDRTTGVPNHALVQLPDGRLLDIDGPHTIEEIDPQYEIRPQDPAAFIRQTWQREDWAYRADPQNKPLARTFVEPLLKRSNLL